MFVSIGSQHIKLLLRLPMIPRIAASPCLLTFEKSFKSLDNISSSSSNSKKLKKSFACSQCGRVHSNWTGRCSSCDAWNSLEEVVSHASASGKRSLNLAKPIQKMIEAVPSTLASSAEYSHLDERLSTGILELDRVFGGGIVPGSLLLIGGEPGIGKSTLILQLADKIATSSSNRVLYVSGEESVRQLGMRASRLNVANDQLLLACETNVEAIQDAALSQECSVIVADSIQTIYTSELESNPGSVSQIREVADKFLGLAKRSGITVILIGHVTKEGNIAGPKLLEHAVDAVLYFEAHRQGQYRLLRNYKNRFGPTSEVAVFEMSHKGLIPLENPSQLFLKDFRAGEAGSAVLPVVEGTRSFLIEIQALLTQNSSAIFPSRRALDIDINRAQMVSAVATHRLGVDLDSFNMHLVAAGGNLRVDHPSADLAILASLLSSYANKPLPPRSVFFGEIGLTGEIRSTSHAASRTLEAFKNGLDQIYFPQSNLKELHATLPEVALKQLSLHPMETVRQLAEMLDLRNVK